MATLYETPAQTTAADMINQEERFNASPATLSYTPATDADGDPLLVVSLNGVAGVRGENYTLAGRVITWIEPSLDPGEQLIARYTPTP